MYTTKVYLLSESFTGSKTNPKAGLYLKVVLLWEFLVSSETFHVHHSRT